MKRDNEAILLLKEYFNIAKSLYHYTIRILNMEKRKREAVGISAHPPNKFELPIN
jgi:hypothetical protein